MIAQGEPTSGRLVIEVLPQNLDATGLLGEQSEGDRSRMSEPPVHTSGDEVHAHAHKTGLQGLDLVIAISAITISVISLFVAVEHGRTEEKLVAANSWPFLVFQSTQNGLKSGSRVLDLRIVNSGVGPARVQSVKITLDGRTVSSRDDLISACCGITSEIWLIR